MAAPAIRVRVPIPLRKYCDQASDLALSAPTVQAALQLLEQKFPMLYPNICDETGSVRRHLGVFVNAAHVRDLDGMKTVLAEGDVLTILMAVSGG